MRSKNELLKILFELRKEAGAKGHLAEKVLEKNTKTANETPLYLIRHLTTP